MIVKELETTSVANINPTIGNDGMLVLHVA